MKKYLKYVPLVLLGLYGIYIGLDNILNRPKFVYKNYNKLMKCEPESYQMKSFDYKGQLDNQPLKQWSVKLVKLKDNSILNAFMLTKNEDPIKENNVFMIGTNCKNISKDQYIKMYQEEKNKSETYKNIYQVYFMAKENSQIELKSGKILDNSVIFNITDDLNEQKEE